MKKTLLLLLILSFADLSLAQVGINTTNPHVSAELEVNSSSRGLLVPRLTTAAVTALSATASEGLIVFNTTTKQFLGFDGTKWQVLGNIPITVTFASWEVNGQANGGPTSFSATSTTQITSASLERGLGLTAPGANNTFGGNNFDNPDLATAIANSDFFTIPIVLPSTSIFSFTKISANNLRRSPTGPAFFQWQFSINGTTYFDISTPINLPITTNLGNDVPEIDLSTISQLQNVSNTTIYLRLVGYAGTGGTGFINDMSGKDLQIIGTYN